MEQPIRTDLSHAPSARLGRLASYMLLAGTGLLASCATGPQQVQAPNLSTTTVQAPNLSATTVLSKLSNPWDMAFLPDGTMFFTEKCKGLSVRMPSGSVNRLLGMKDSQGYATTAGDLFCDGQAGMAGVAVDPNFASNRFVYVYSTSSMASPSTNRVIRFTVSPDAARLTDRKDIVTDIPYKVAKSNHPFGDTGAHNGGRLRFGPGDGLLYVTTGDTHNGEVPQSPTRIGGKCCASTAKAARPRATTRRRDSIRASTPTATAIRRASPSVRGPTRPSRPRTDPGIRTRSRC